MADRTCTITDCRNPSRARGMCRMHYLRWRKSGNPGPAETSRRAVLPHCIIDGCEEPPKGRGLCNLHYQRWRKNGDPGSAESLVSRNPTECTMDGCSQPPKAHGLCNMHYVRWHRHGDPERVDKSSGNSKGDEVTYSAVHMRLRQSRGSATDHSCRRCGSQADEWAYDHSDPNERLDDKNRPYSTDPARYITLCRSCHRTLDAATP